MVTTYVQADRDRPRSFVLRRPMAAAATCAALLLLAGRRSGASQPAASVAFGQAPLSTAITMALAHVAVPATAAA